jgi:hypothetical protein
VAWVDLAAEQQDGSPYVIWPCTDCMPWHAEVLRAGDALIVREWHAVDCPALQDLVADPPRLSVGR